MIQKFIPPILAQMYFKYIKKQQWKGKYFDWLEAKNQCGGYNSEIIFEKVKTAILAVRDGKAVYERDTMLFEKIQYSWEILSGLLMVAAKNGGNLKVLDFGGSLGSSFFQNRKFLNELAYCQWNIVEQDHWVKFGQNELQTAQLKFYSSIPECLSKTQPHAILIANTIQYIEDYKLIIDLINHSSADYILVDMLPVDNRIEEGDEYICVQRVPSTIYSASYPCRIFAQNTIPKLLFNYHLFESFENSLKIFVNGNSVQYQGFILKRNNL